MTQQQQQHPITPPPELVEQWADMLASRSDEAVFSLAAQWGADQELEACCALMDEWGLCGEDLMQCRRPKPPSLKEQALKELAWVDKNLKGADFFGRCGAVHTIRRALEQLDD
jgi:hypothetical protein